MCLPTRTVRDEGSTVILATRKHRAAADGDLAVIGRDGKLAEGSLR